MFLHPWLRAIPYHDLELRRLRQAEHQAILWDVGQALLSRCRTQTHFQRIQSQCEPDLCSNSLVKPNHRPASDRHPFVSTTAIRRARVSTVNSPVVEDKAPHLTQ
jgi:hypothetical protein